MDLQFRIRRLVKEYAMYDTNSLKTAVNKIAEKLGGTRTKEVLEALDKNDYETVTIFILGYYDKTYDYAVGRRKNKNTHSIALSGDDPEQNAKLVLRKAISLIGFARNGKAR